MMAAVGSAVPRVDWEQFWERNGGLRPGQHVSVVGPTGTGKTYTLTYFAESFPGHAILIVTKGADELVERLTRERGWLYARDPEDIFTPDGRPGRLLRRSWGERWEGRARPPQRIVYMPQVDVVSLRARADLLQAAVETVIDRAYEYCRRAKANHLFVGIDETMFAAMELNMTRPFTMIWNEGRSLGLSFGSAMQRPAWIPKSAKSAPTFIVIFDTVEPDDSAELAKIAGFDNPRDFRRELDALPEYHHLLVVTRGRGRRVFRSRVVIRKRGGAEQR
jgi:DNA helicase HerA-like ATPase